MSASGVVARFLHRSPQPVDAAPTTAMVAAEAQSYYGGDSSLGVLLCQGFSGTPQSVRAWAQHLELDGFRVAAPRLPGHGTSWQELNLTRWEDWYSCVATEFWRLREQCEQVFVCGLSMGGTLALRLAEQVGDEISGLTLVNPSVSSRDPRYQLLFLLRHLTPSFAGIASDIAMPGALEVAYDRAPLSAGWSLTKLWQIVREDLDRVDQPLLVYKSRTDHVVDSSSLQFLRARVASTDFTVVDLERSYHVATLDWDADLIFSGSSAFFQRLAKTVST